MMDPIVYGWIGRGRVAITGAITIDGTYRGLTVDVTSGTFSIAFLAAATLGSGYHVAIYNSGSGVVTLNPNASEPIRFPNGSAVTKTLAQGQGCVLACTGTGWEAIAGAGLNTATTVTGSGTINRLAMFTATGSTIGDSTIANGSITGVLTFAKTGVTARTHTFQDLAGTVAALEATQTFTAANTFNGVTNFAAGSVGTPTIYLGSSSGTGWFQGAANQWEWSGSGVGRLRLVASGVNIYNLNATTISGLGTSSFSNTAFNVHGADSTGLNIAGMTYTGDMMFIGRVSGGTGASPAATPSGQQVGYALRGHTGSGFTSVDRAGMYLVATETWSTTANGSRIDFKVTAPTTVTTATQLSINSNGVGYGNYTPVSGNGLAQFATGTTKANGIGWGTDTFLYRDASNSLLTDGSLRSKGATSGIGYATGSGGTVTQGTSRTTGVTLDKINGEITLFSAAGSATATSFTVTCSAMAATDHVVLNQQSGTDKYVLLVTAKAAGSFQITFYTTGGTTVETPVFSFGIIKGVNA